MRARPSGPATMYQTWSLLTFLHWECDPSTLQSLLPEGITVDAFEGRAYVGLVPFTMSGIRVRGLPPIPGTVAFHETNVRTYVVNERGEPGVWFFSLDASSAVAVSVARAWYRLPYYWAVMEVSSCDGAVRYQSDRRRAGPDVARCRVVAKAEGASFNAEPGTLEFFLVERYQLFASSNGRLYSGQVHHEPYPIQRAVCVECEQTLTFDVGVDVPPVEPIAHFCAGVSVEVFPLRAR